MSRYFETRYPFHPGRTRVWKAICEYLQRDVPEDASVVELGAGYCDFINQVKAGKRYAVDIDPQAGRYCDPQVRFLNTGLGDVPLPDGSIDVAFASNLLEHLGPEELEGLLATLARILTARGRLILLQPNYYYCYRRYWDDFTHVKAYSHESLPDMLAFDGYTIKRVEKRFLPFSFKGRLPSSYLLTRLYLALPWRPLARQMLVVAERG